MSNAHRPHYVYRCYDAADALLYVGVSANPSARLAAHRNTSAWIFDAVTTRYTVFPNAEHARRIERRAIAEENPRWNVMGRWANRGLWGPEEYGDYYAAVRANLSSSEQQRRHLERVAAEAHRRYGISLGGAAA